MRPLLHVAHITLTVVACMLVGIAATVAQDAPKRAITQIAGDLYRFQNNFHYSVFLVTPAGVIATDPINAEAAAWLEAEIQTRFGQEIKYLILSHDHADHSAGGEVFADTAVVVAHEKAKQTIIGEQRPTAVPDITFSDRMTIELGGKAVELSYLGRSHSDNMIVMNFPAERALFTVDFISVKRLPYMTLTDAYFPDWIEAIRKGRGHGLRHPGAGPRAPGREGRRQRPPGLHGRPLRRRAGRRARGPGPGADAGLDQAGDLQGLGPV